MGTTGTAPAPRSGIDRAQHPWRDWVLGIARVRQQGVTAGLKGRRIRGDVKKLAGAPPSQLQGRVEAIKTATG